MSPRQWYKSALSPSESLSSQWHIWSMFPKSPWRHGWRQPFRYGEHQRRTRWRWQTHIQSTVKHPTWYSRKTINDVEDILCYPKPGDNAANWRISLPEDLILPTIKWYHQVTGSPGSKRLYKQLKQRYYHRDLRRLADNLNCDFCQRNKLDGKGYGFLPEREVHSIPVEECAVDLIGP